MTVSRKGGARAQNDGFGTILRRFMRHRMLEIIGVTLGVLALALAVSLLSFHNADPSLNKTGAGDVANWLGLGGAYASELLLQIVGLASGVLVLCLMGWSWRMLAERRMRGWMLRVAALMGALVAFSAVLSPLHAWQSWPIGTGLGGTIGMLIYNAAAGMITDYAAIPLFAALSIALIGLASGLRMGEWLGIAFAVMAVFAKAWRGLNALLAMARSGEWSATDDDEAEASPRARVREKKAPTPKLHVKKAASKRNVEMAEEKAPKASQTSFDLEERFTHYELPSTALLSKVPAKSKKKKVTESSLSQNAELLEQTLNDFGVQGEIIRVRPGPVVTLYELEPAAGVKSSRVIGVADDIARSMSATSARIAVIPGKNALGIELPNSSRETVYIREMYESSEYEETEMKLPLVLGKDISGEAIIADLARMPHLLVAGTTGSGKSVAINTMITSLMYHLTPDQCRFIMIDPKMLELSVYDGIPHLLSPVVTEPGKAVVALKWTVKEMENRYRLMSNLGVRNIDNYNKRIKEAAKKGEELFRSVQTGFDPESGKPQMEKVAIDMNPLPMIVVVVDEMADLMLVAGKDIEGSIQRLAQMARAAGIHIIMATQRPSVDVITGVIKANFPTRISFQVTSKIDSRTILGEQGAEQLLGQGDMLYMAGGGRIQRVHGPFISDKEVEQIVDFLKTQGEPEYVEEVTIDDEEGGGFGMEETGDAEEDLYNQAVQIVLNDQKASTSYIQRKLKIGYNRAARLIDRMEEEGVVGAANHVGKREVLARTG
jgi:S-DNA-T family DNA segregation ATPase FtsK/SpoIIIE